MADIIEFASLGKAYRHGIDWLNDDEVDTWFPASARCCLNCMGVKKIKSEWNEYLPALPAEDRMSEHVCSYWTPPVEIRMDSGTIPPNYKGCNFFDTFFGIF